MAKTPKKIALVTKMKTTCDALSKQLSGVLGDEALLTSYYIEGNISEGITADLIIISSREISDEARHYTNPSCPSLVARRSVDYRCIDKLLRIPEGTEALLVNDLQSATLETIEGLIALGIDHIRYYPWYPGARDVHRTTWAVTPGEVQLVPDFVQHIVDIHCRNIDFTTIVEIFRTVGVSEEKTQLLSANHAKAIIELTKRARTLAQTNRKVNSQLHTIINTVHDGIVALDEKDCVSVFNHVAEGLFGLARDEVLGRPISAEKLGRDGSLVLSSVGEEKERFINVGGKRVVVNSARVLDRDKNLFTVHTLKDVTEIQRLEEEMRRRLVSAQYCARYTFDDIAGNSAAIQNAKRLAQLVSDSHSHVLIQGESGTGKELFAQAIHNASPRRSGPFVAVNFAALPETLLESELFGYEDGAFTGARKGGNPGLFEQGHRGTVFLDEIGDAPVSFQIRLLRVLQEKQVRRIGSSRHVPVDVRVISATNKDLKLLIMQKVFRQDLYYRLNILPLMVPALRERRQDIMILASLFYSAFFAGAPPVTPEDYFKDVEGQFLNYTWPGNIRELNNVVEYLSNVSPDAPPSASLLPEQLVNGLEEGSWAHEEDEASTVKQLLLRVAESNRLGIPIGRRSIATQTMVSEAVARRLLERLRRDGYISVSRGIKGIRLSKRGQGIVAGEGSPPF